MDPAALSQALKAKAQELGFDLAGVCAAVEPAGFSRLGEWLEAGYAGEMSYLPDRQDAYRHPQSVLAGVRSLVMLGASYRTSEPKETQPGQGRISRYAWGPVDYHDVLHERLKKLAAFLKELAPEAQARGVVDTAPLLEREFAQLAGLGWIGKNTLLLNKRAGSWFFLAALLTDQELAPDEPHVADHCGTCRACLDACPTDAFVAPQVLDATRCLSYLTIELRGPVPQPLRTGIGDWLFGCDVCQDVCPWNHRAPQTDELSFAPLPENDPIDLCELFYLRDEDFRARFRRTPLWRSRRRGILRNAALVLGNRPAPEAIEPLVHGLNDPEPIVRGACAWALGRFPRQVVQAALEARLATESDESTRHEIQLALAQTSRDAL